MPDSSQWVQVFKPQIAPVCRLFCIPFAGGSVQSFNRWQDQLPVGLEVCAVQLPGRETRMRETPISDVHAIVDALTPSLMPYLDRPFAIFGHSMGALIAYELTRRLEHECHQPELLIASARVAPHLRVCRDPISDLSKEEFIEALRRFKATPEEILGDSALMDLILPMLRADFAVHEKYVHRAGPKLRCDVLAFGGLRDIEAGRAELDQWREATSGAFSLRMVPGDHFFIQSAKSLFLRMLSLELYQAMKRVELRQATPKACRSGEPSAVKAPYARTRSIEAA